LKVNSAACWFLLFRCRVEFWALKCNCREITDYPLPKLVVLKTIKLLLNISLMTSVAKPVF